MRPALRLTPLLATLAGVALLVLHACTGSNFNGDTGTKNGAKDADTSTDATTDPSCDGTCGMTNCTKLDEQACKDQKIQDHYDKSFRDVDCRDKTGAQCAKAVQDAIKSDGSNGSLIRVKNCEPADSAECKKLGDTPGISVVGSTGKPGTPTELGTGGGTSTDPGELDTPGNTTVQRLVAKLEITTKIDHDSQLVINADEIHFHHTLLGIPTQTRVKAYDADGKLINDQDWTPEFKENQGDDCHPTMRATLYCEVDAPCKCDSDKLTLAAGHKLKGKVTKVSGRDSAQKTGDSPITISIEDHDDGASTYVFTVE
jgi:hypothetical protein